MDLKKYGLVFLLVFSLLLGPKLTFAEEEKFSNEASTTEIREVSEESVITNETERDSLKESAEETEETTEESTISEETTFSKKAKTALRNQEEIYVTSEWKTDYDMRIVVGGHGIHNQPYGLAGTVTYGNTSNHINRAVQVTYAKLLSNNVTFYRYQMDGNTYWTDSRAFTSAKNPYVTSEWKTDYDMRIVVGGHGIHNQPYGLAGTVTYGNTSNHINRAVQVTYAKLLSNNVTFYRYQMDGNTYWTDSRAFTSAKNPYVTSEWKTDYDMRIVVGGHGIHNQPYGLAGTVTYGNTSNHINRAVQVTYAKLLSNNVTFYRYQMDGNTYWTDSRAFTSAKNPYVTSEWKTDYDMRIAVGGHGIHNQPYGLAGTVTYGNTSNHINKEVKVTYAKLLSNNVTFYRYQMDGNTYWTDSRAFGPRSTQHDLVVNLALKYLGVPYLSGGNTPAGFDCSGLVQYVYKNAVNINLPRVTTGQETSGREVSLNSLQKGDLLFWGAKGATYHVAIYIGDNQFIHAPVPGKVVEKINISSYRPTFARRILPNL
ncbi:NlpC/P60 family protein [Enterococcus sp. AZ192]|uniref:NlpC/P60 family protein n=1 Tax=unclassified Enterococcus TaxID=2608891 RepID=UPI003D27FEEB